MYVYPDSNFEAIGLILYNFFLLSLFLTLVIKTLPQYEPWITFRRTYWKLFAVYVATSSLLDDDTTMETIDKN